jgi:hypothetical protein
LLLLFYFEKIWLFIRDELLVTLHALSDAVGATFSRSRSSHQCQGFRREMFRH